ncbi:MAG: DUF4173 domain-containing protein [Longicatena sp.]
MNKKRIEHDALLNAPNVSIYTHYNIFMACAIALISYLGIRFLQPFHMEEPQAILLILYVILSAIYARLYFPFTRKTYTSFIFLFLCCIPNLIFDNYFLKFFNVCFILLVLSHTLLVLSHKQIHENGQYFFIDILNAFTFVPLQGIKTLCQKLVSLSKEALHLQHVGAILIGIIISVPILLVVIPLLLSADLAFQRFVLYFFSNINNLIKEIIYIIFSFPVFTYLYSLIYGNMNCERADVIKVEKNELDVRMNKTRIIPITVPMTIEVILIMVYTIFLILSTSDIIKNMSMSLESFSFSHFAREGFFQLCIISAINLLVLVCMHLISKQTHSKIQYGIKRILCVETIALLCTAMLKMVLYISAYGLTPLRVYSSWFLIILLGTFVLILYHISHTEDKTLRHIIKYFCIAFLFLNLLNVDTFIIKYNQTMPTLVEDSSYVE